MLANELNINPARAAKGIRLLVERGVLEKVRGQAMTVKVGAMKEIKKRKVEEILGEIIERFVDEATKLGIGEDALVERVKEAVKRKSEKE